MLMDINYDRCNERQTVKLNSLSNFPAIRYMLYCIPVRGQIKETTRVDNLRSYPLPSNIMSIFRQKKQEVWKTGTLE